MKAASPAVMLSAVSNATCPTCERRVVFFDGAPGDFISKIQIFAADKFIVLHRPEHGGFGVRAGGFNELYEQPRT